MVIIYRLLTSFIYFIFYPIFFLFFIKNNFKQRSRIKDVPVDQSIWIHASSVGEVNAIKPFIIRLLDQFPKIPIVMTCMTQTGLETAQKISGKLIVRQFPFDIYPVIHQAYKVIKPSIIFLVETELWPNMLSIAAKKKIPVIMLNARISDRSYPRYKVLRFFWKSLLKKINLVLTQSEKDKERYEYLGAVSVHNCNNLKFSINLPTYDKSELRKAWKYNFNDYIIAFGSSRPGEEKLFIEIIRKIADQIPRLKAIIVPRHLHRLSELKPLLQENEYSLFSENKNDSLFMIVDEMGILPQVYAISDTSIIGGSFFNFGGHNPLEAAFYEVPVLIGPYHSSCEDIVHKLKQNEAIIISSAEQLSEDLLNLASNIEIRRQLGKRAKDTVIENMNSLDLHFELIKPWVQKIKA